MLKLIYEEPKFKNCYYANNLLQKILLLNKSAVNKVDIVKIKKAIFYAQEYHGPQRRQSGEPYYSHPLQVAYMVADYNFNTDILIASILHDTMEDTIMTKETINCVFGSNIANQVEDLTRIKKNFKMSSEQIVESLWNQQKYDALLIKTFDRLHNMQTIYAKPLDKIKKTTTETLEVFINLAMHLGIKKIAFELEFLCRKYYTKP